MAGVLSFFMIRRNQPAWALTPMENGCELSLHHATGVVTEYFSTPASALRRANELNDRLNPQRPTRGRRRVRATGARRRRR